MVLCLIVSCFFMFEFLTDRIDRKTGYRKNQIRAIKKTLMHFEKKIFLKHNPFLCPHFKEKVIHRDRFYGLSVCHEN